MVYNQGVGDSKLFLKVFRERLHDIFKQNWYMRLEESTRASFYRAIKPSFIYSTYQESILPKKHRMALTRLLVSSHRLHVETGRWERPVIPREHRYCQHCPSKIEDEFHLLLECRLYSEIRLQLIPKYYWHRPSTQKAIDLINNPRKSIRKRLGKFVHLAFGVRQ